MFNKPFTQQQLAALMAPLNANRVSKRSQGGRQLSYLEAWDVKAALIRVFGFANFSADVVHARVERMERDVPAYTGSGDSRKRKMDADGNPDFNWSVTAQATVRLTIHATGATYTETAIASQTGPDVGEVADFAMKGLSLDTPIPTPNGWTTMGDVQVGEVVYDMDGLPTMVEMKSEVKHLPCFRVTFNDGRQIVCDEEHYWYASLGGRPVAVYGIGDLFEAKESGTAVTIPLAGPLHAEDASLEVDPYTLGQWLGDGDRASGRLTVNALDLEHVMTHVDASNYTPDPRSNAVTVRVNGLTTTLRHSGILGSKVIPAEYMRASAAQRLALLSGLVDSDGTVSLGRPVFCSTSRILAEQVAELVASLGDRPTISSVQTSGYGKAITAHYVTWTPTLNPFTLPRKAEKVVLRKKRGVHRVRSIERIESVPTQCIGVDSPTKSYLAGEFMVPTHNTAESDALKRAAIYLGTQFGLGLYDNGGLGDVVRVLLEPDQRETLEGKHDEDKGDSKGDDTAKADPVEEARRAAAVLAERAGAEPVDE